MLFADDGQVFGRDTQLIGKRLHAASAPLPRMQQVKEPVEVGVARMCISLLISYVGSHHPHCSAKREYGCTQQGLYDIGAIRRMVRPVETLLQDVIEAGVE